MRLSSYSHFPQISNEPSQQLTETEESNQQNLQNAKIRFITEVMEAIDGLLAEFDNLTEQINLYVSLCQLQLSLTGYRLLNISTIMK